MCPLLYLTLTTTVNVCCINTQLISNAFSRGVAGSEGTGSSSSSGGSSSGSGSSAETLKRNRTEQFMDILEAEFSEKVSIAVTAVH